MNIKSYEHLLIAESNILEKGYVCYKDLIQVCEQRPWIITALADYARTETFDLQPQYIEKEMGEGFRCPALDYFKAVNQFLRSHLENLPVGLFNGEVYVN